MSMRWYRSEQMVPGLRAKWLHAERQAAAAPAEVVDWLARLRLLHGVPFAYLVPDADLLPPESIRFFWLDRDWTDAAVEGALSAAGAHSQVRSAAVAQDGATRRMLDKRERNISPHIELPRGLPEGVQRQPSGGPVGPAANHVGEVPYDTMGGGPEVVTGFLLRSRAVSGWPGIAVRGLRDGSELRLLRVERLAPAVLLVLFDGLPDEVHVEEPRRGLQFGVDPAADVSDDNNSRGGRRVKLRDVADGRPLSKEGARVPLDPPTSTQYAYAPVPFRAGTSGVVDMAALARSLHDAMPAGASAAVDFTADHDAETWPQGVSSAELTTQLLQFPYRQRFEGDGFDPDGGGLVTIVLAATTPLRILDVVADIEGLG
jgi:hypothetical protein